MPSLPPVRRAAVIAAFALSIILLTFLVRPPLAAAQDQSVYPPDTDSRTFSTSAGGWASTTGSIGICLPPLACPSVTNSYETGGAGDGFIRATLDGVTGVQPVTGTVTSTWTSPSFTYEGVDGQRAAAVRFSLDRRADVAQLLSVTGASATFQVNLVDQSASSTAQTIVSPTSLAATTAWTPLGDVSVPAGDLAVGHQYAIAIVTSYGTGASVVPTATADYDNVTLTAIGQSSEGAGGGNGKGGPGDGGTGGGNNSSSQISASQLRDAVAGSAPTTAQVVSGGRAGHAKVLRIKVKCPRKAKKACTIAARAQLSRKGAAITTTAKVHLKAGRSKVLRLLVRPRHAKALARRKVVFVRQLTKVGKVHVVTIQKRTLHTTVKKK